MTFSKCFCTRNSKFYVSNCRIRAQTFITAAQEIIQLFPGELVTTYYTPYIAPQIGLRKQPARGMLYSRYINVKTALRLAVISSPPSKKRSLEEVSELTTTADDSIAKSLNFLRESIAPVPKIISAWEETFDQRRTILEKKPLDELFAEFPALGCQFGVELVTSLMFYMFF